MKYNLKPAPKTIEVCRIYLNDEPVTVISGKNYWKHIGHAKSALRRHLRYYFLSQQVLGKTNRELVDKTMLEFEFKFVTIIV